LGKDADEELPFHRRGDLRARVAGGARAPPLRRMTAWRWLRLLALWSRDGQLLDDLVVAPLLRIVVGHLEHEVLRLLAITFPVEGDVAGDARELGLPDGGGHVLAGQLARLGGLLDREDRDVGGVVRLGGVGLRARAPTLLS